MKSTATCRFNLRLKGVVPPRAKGDKRRMIIFDCENCRARRTTVHENLITEVRAVRHV